MPRHYVGTFSMTEVRKETVVFSQARPYSPSKPMRNGCLGGVGIMEKHKFIFVRWPSGEWTIALDREYDLCEMEEF